MTLCRRKKPREAGPALSAACGGAAEHGKSLSKKLSFSFSEQKSNPLLQRNKGLLSLGRFCHALDLPIQLFLTCRSSLTLKLSSRFSARFCIGTVSFKAGENKILPHCVRFGGNCYKFLPSTNLLPPPVPQVPLGPAQTDHRTHSLPTGSAVGNLYSSVLRLPLTWLNKPHLSLRTGRLFLLPSITDYTTNRRFCQLSFCTITTKDFLWYCKKLAAVSPGRRAHA